MTDAVIRLYFIEGPQDNVADIAIRRASLGAWQTHVGCMLPASAAIASHFSMVDTTQIGIAAHWDDGVQYRDIWRDEKWTKRIDCIIPCTQAQSDAHTAWLINQIGKPYDKGAIENMALGLIHGVNEATSDWGSWICSTLQHMALLEPNVGILKWHANPLRQTMPHELMYALEGISTIVEYPPTDYPMGQPPPYHGKMLMDWNHPQSNPSVYPPPTNYDAIISAAFQRIQALEMQFAALRGRIDLHDAQLATNQGDIAALKAQVAALMPQPKP